MEKLKFFLGFQIKQTPKGIYIHQTKYVKEEKVKHICRYPIGTSNLRLMFKRSESFRLTSYCDVGDKVERKSTCGSCHFIGVNLLTWICKKKGLTALSTAEAEYMSATSYYAQLLGIKNQLEDYNICESKISIYCDNKTAISLS